MSKQARASHPIYSLLPTEIEGFDSLAELALDMHWSWNHATDEVGRQYVTNEVHMPTWDSADAAGQRLFEVEVYLHELDPAATRVELYADGVDGGGAVRQEMERVGQLAGGSNGCTSRTRVSAARPATDYTARSIPSYAGVAVPVESLRILWR